MTTLSFSSSEEVDEEIINECTGNTGQGDDQERGGEWERTLDNSPAKLPSSLYHSESGLMGSDKRWTSYEASNKPN